ncbi:glycogen debranching enzyme GlgX [Mesorhizobium sp. M2D.F.Ca.ET.185.01.1.1]|uniref:glycogen debranching protein GlgX n=1 Tax=unclassified Mesorhizobium TaxID=325217 RepID=UPI000FCB71E8|nr:MULTISPECIES: glycogen debranching protein GlgX [unclassified Mesorhizobium]TGP76268.1 glycogen debranching enzyme GlgX [bacterium M00.F.Ca.ET.227.01.1.1]TGP92321.1 glycogen debranching enzyme GlgX [bacterium M00.F.Ca.ET.222.01.1.1]TGP96875.1 glycogen debranching enzyme GlgX [bacterium M00.F.Ca.ET.221.01.1.1]TGU06663.1 glycogen debranching enzyme GlgX [bacterium M00.F.Ca.ET.163.01.1.1]TGU27708.1 glycogen debranching enzyme GlgX [bacterium M00.F.Ca.ET.156.01.1.1]TGU50087.1 glycogen debranch
MTLGATITAEGIRFAVWSSSARRLWISIFDDSGARELDRLELKQEGEGVHALLVPGLGGGARYGFRADGDYAPERGLWFDPNKLLTDPYAVEVDRPYQYHWRLAAKRNEGADTAWLMPKAIARSLPLAVPAKPPLFQPGGLIYELNVRSFTKLHPDIPEAQRGTIAALAHPAVIEHLKRLSVSAVELMPITASIDERHLPPLSLSNAWGYNPVTFMALDPRLAPGGLSELRNTVATLRKAGIGTILDLVFNHTGESDRLGPTLSLRGLDAQAYFRHQPDGRLVNDTGTGNTVACDHPVVREMVLDSLRHFVRFAGVDGFRFDLAPVLGRVDGAFDPEAPLLGDIAGDPVLADRVLIAEPWDIGPNGYQLGNFRPPYLEWNDRYRDDIRRFWRGDAGALGSLATRLAGSSDVFGRDGQPASRTVNFIAAHDGMALADIVAYERKHNEANGEQNRDGHNDNLSWNNGAEGETDETAIGEARFNDQCALLATLFASRGTIMLTAGDEFGRTQKGNNNAYAQDNALTWLDWAGRDQALEQYTASLAALRSAFPALADPHFLTGEPASEPEIPDVVWLSETGTPLAESDWNDPGRHRLVMLLGDSGGGRLAVIINGDRRQCVFTLPAREGFEWRPAVETQPVDVARPLPGRSVGFMIERRAAGSRNRKDS